MSIHRTIPSSITRFVDAVMNARDGTNAAPILKTVRVVAAAAYEQDELAIPNPIAMSTSRRPFRPNMSDIFSLLTNTWRPAEIENPRTSAQSISHNIAAA